MNVEGSATLQNGQVATTSGPYAAYSSGHSEGPFAYRSFSAVSSGVNASPRKLARRENKTFPGICILELVSLKMLEGAKYGKVRTREMMMQAYKILRQVWTFAGGGRMEPGCLLDACIER
jgi:hypothetical protein